MDYAELHCISNLSFLRGASHPAELIARAAALGYRAIAITDECSLAGIVRAHVAAREHGLKLIAGSEFRLPEDLHLVLLAPDRAAYSALSGLITLGRRRADKGSYALRLDDLPINARGCLAIWVPAEDASDAVLGTQASHLASLFKGRLWLGVELLRGPEEQQRYLRLHAVARAHAIPMVACGGVEMHEASRKSLADVLAAVRLGVPVQQLGKRIGPNAERHLRPVATLARLYLRNCSQRASQSPRAATSRWKNSATNTPKNSCPQAARRASGCVNSCSPEPPGAGREGSHTG